MYKRQVQSRLQVKRLSEKDSVLFVIHLMQEIILDDVQIFLELVSEVLLGLKRSVI